MGSVVAGSSLVVFEGVLLSGMVVLEFVVEFASVVLLVGVGSGVVEFVLFFVMVIPGATEVEFVVVELVVSLVGIV